MKVLITGGAGTLGAALIDHWYPKGYEFIIIDNFTTGNLGNIPELKNMAVIEGSISNYELVKSTFEKFTPDICIHSAASYKDPTDWYEDVNTNIIGTINIIRAAENTSLKKLIHFQTALTYGRPSTVPISEKEKSSPFTSYGISKTASEGYLMMASIPTLSLRIANVTGPRLSIGPIPTFYKRLKEGKRCFCTDSARDFIDIRDFLSFMDLAIKDKSPVGIYNISTGEEVSIHKIFKSVCRHLKLNPEQEVPILPIADDDVKTVVLDPTKAKQDFKWEPVITYDEMMTYVLSWYDKYGVTDVYSHLMTKPNPDN